MSFVFQILHYGPWDSIPAAHLTPGSLYMAKIKTFSLTLCLITLLACGVGNFGQQLRLILAAGGPLVESLPLSTGIKSGLITDFTDMGNGAATLGDCLSSATDKPAKLVCVSTFDMSVETVIARGHFGEANSPKLQRIETLIQGIIASAKIYYGGTPKTSADARVATIRTEPVTEASLKAQIEALKREMKP